MELAIRAQKRRPYKVLLVGDAGVGKTALVNFLATGQFTQAYVPTFGADTQDGIIVTTTEGEVSMTFWDIAGQERLAGIEEHRDAWYRGADAAILMFDLTSRVTLDNLEHWYRGIVQRCGTIPMVLVGNKCDIPERRVQPADITFHQGKNMEYQETSLKNPTPTGVSHMILALLSRLMERPTLEMRAVIVCQGAEVYLYRARPVMRSTRLPTMSLPHGTPGNDWAMRQKMVIVPWEGTVR